MMDIDKFWEAIKTIRENTDRNAHIENYIFICSKAFLNAPKLRKIFEAIGKIQDAEGHLDMHLNQYRFSVYQRMMKLAKQELGATDYKALHDSL